MRTYLRTVGIMLICNTYKQRQLLSLEKEYDQVEHKGIKELAEITNILQLQSAHLCHRIGQTVQL